MHEVHVFICLDWGLTLVSLFSYGWRFPTISTKMRKNRRKEGVSLSSKIGKTGLRPENTPYRLGMSKGSNASPSAHRRVSPSLVTSPIGFSVSMR